MKDITVILIYSAIAVLIVWDLYVMVNGRTSDTISAVMLAQASKHPVIAFGLGIVAGHLFWPQFKQ